MVAALAMHGKDDELSPRPNGPTLLHQASWMVACVGLNPSVRARMRGVPCTTVPVLMLQQGASLVTCRPAPVGLDFLDKARLRRVQ
eukprot:1159488-Pelagomonas_calceolata.AAC.12